MSKLLIENILDREDMIMTEWKKIKVSDIGNVITGKTPKTSNTSYYGGHIPFLTPSDDMSKKYVKETKKYITEEGRRSVKNSILPVNAICVSCIGSDLGKVMITTEETVTNQQINSIIVDEEKYDVDYIYYSMLELGKILNFHSKTSTAVPIINKSTFSQYELICPSLNIQKKIGSLLSTIDLKIELNLKINNNLEQQAQTIFKSWFVDFAPFEKKMPSNWSNGTIDDLAKEIVCGKTPPTKNAEYYGTKIPFITIPDMHGKIYSVTTERYLSILGANSQVKKSLPKNSVCVSCIGTAGLVTLVAEESQTNQQINSIIPKDGFSPYFIYLLMQTLYDTINKLGQSGSTIVNLNKTQFGKIQVTIPTVSVMINFDKIMFPIFEKILQNQKENLSLVLLRDSLLPKLMSGELDVSEIDS